MKYLHLQCVSFIAFEMKREGIEHLRFLSSSLSLELK